jgi:hypothetical protein
MLSDLEYSLFGYFYAFRFLGLQDELNHFCNPDGCIKLNVSPVEAMNWIEYKKRPTGWSGRLY